MRFNFEQTLKNFEGQEVKNERNEVVTLKSACLNSVLATFPDEKSITGEEKLKRYNLAKKISKNEDITIEEIAMTKTLVGKAANPLLVGIIYEILERKDETKAAKTKSGANDEASS